MALISATRVALTLSRSLPKSDVGKNYRPRADKSESPVSSWFQTMQGVGIQSNWIIINKNRWWGC